MFYASVEYCGGLGNQLFQFFTLLNYCIETQKIPVLEYAETSPSVTKRATYWESVFSSFKNFSKITDGVKVQVTQNFVYVDLPNLPSNVVLDGYFQSYKFFSNYFCEIKSFLKFEEKIETVKEKYFSDFLRKKDEKEILVSVHFRLGDYKRLQHDHPLLPISYYEKSLNFFSGKKIKILYFCEEEDADYIEKEYLPKLGVADSAVRVWSSIPDWEQLFLMSLCDWNIIANSTFSWWGAYLNKKTCYLQ